LIFGRQFSHLFQFFLLLSFQQTPDTIAEVVTINSEVKSFEVNVGKEAFLYKKKFGISGIVFSKRTAHLEKVRTEKNPEECQIAPWEQLEV